MIIELSFALVEGLNLRLERSWDSIKAIMQKYPKATWKKIVDKKKNKCKYLIEVN